MYCYQRVITATAQSLRHQDAMNVEGVQSGTVITLLLSRC